MAEEENDTEDLGAGSKTLGIERWVLFGYIVCFALSFWFFGKVIELVWDEFAEPNDVAITAAAALAGLLLTVGLYLKPNIKSFAFEAANELSKVTWPTRQETWNNTVVVIVTSAIAALILFGFDALWSALTDMIYSRGLS